MSELKIDRSFVQEIESSEQDRVLVGSMIRLGHDLGLQVCAEGVETNGQREILSELDCDIAQGFLWYEPMPATGFASIVQSVLRRP